MSAVQKARIDALPPQFFYIPDFISAEEETFLLDKITIGRWVQLSRRRLQTHPSALTATNTLFDAALPSWLQNPIVHRFEQLGLFDDAPHRAPNHVLINEYEPGQGIMPHEDGSAYHPVVATISLGGPIALDIYPKRDSGEREEHPRWRILQEERSLLVSTGAAYSDLLHGIAEIEVDEDLGPDTVANWVLLGDKGRLAEGKSKRVTRTSLTYRDVLKVSKIGNRILGKRTPQRF